MRMSGQTKPSRLWIWAALLFAGTFAVFCPALNFDFVGIDDPTFVSANPHVLGGLSAADVKWAFQLGQGDYWHPLAWLSLMLDVTLFGPGPRGLHFTNIILHSANAALLFWLLATSTGRLGRSAVVAALFAWHPLRIESVAWITERKDVLSVFFFLLALIAYAAYARNRAPAPQAARTGSRWGAYFASLLFFVLGLMSKAMIVTLPCVMLLADYWPLRRIDPATWNRRPVVPGQLLLEKTPFFVLAAGSAALTYWGQHVVGNVTPLGGFAPLMRLQNACIAYTRYLRQTFWPANLSMWYPHPGTWPSGSVVAAALLLALISAAALVAARRRPYLFVGWCWFAGTLLPVAGLTKGWFQFMADRFTYIPSIGLFLALVWSAAELLPAQRNRAACLFVTAVAAMAACASATRAQIGVWANSEALFRHALAATPDNWLAESGLALALKRKGEFEEALAHYEKSLRIEPNYEDTLNNCGSLLLTLGRVDEAIDKFQAAAQLDPRNPSPHNNLGVAFYRQGRLDDAISQLQQALALKPDDSKARSNLVALIEERTAQTNAAPR
jgi:tetratricopeptide (TPR) repeat protein